MAKTKDGIPIYRSVVTYLFGNAKAGEFLPGFLPTSRQSCKRIAILDRLRPADETTEEERARRKIFYT